MLEEVWRAGAPIRLLGVAVTGFGEDEYVQESLFGDDERSGEGEHDSSYSQGAANRQKLRELIEATDRVRDRFGEDALRYGRELRSIGNTTGTASKNPADYK